VRPFDPGAPFAWRVDRREFAKTWDSGIGANENGGRWNPEGFACVYASFASSTAILEMAVHIGVRALTRVPHVVTRFEILDPARIHIVRREDVPNPHWLVPGSVSEGQQEFGRALIEKHDFVAVPSVVAPDAWNLVFEPSKCRALYASRAQIPLALDPRLDKPRARV
jgi:RES domain-containing protein